MNDTLSASQRPTLESLDTPCLVLDETRMTRNIERLNGLMAGHGVRLRPHLKTPKSIDVARRVMTGPPALRRSPPCRRPSSSPPPASRTCSTPWACRRQTGSRAGPAPPGADLTVVVDSLQAASAVAGRAQAQGEIIPALIEIDCDGHRAGVQPGNTEQLLAIARELHGAGCLRGVMTHAGESYGCRSVEAIADMAEQERRAAVSCADAIRAAGLPCPVVSVGSTPTAHFARSLEGVTECAPASTCSSIW